MLLPALSIWGVYQIDREMVEATFFNREGFCGQIENAAIAYACERALFNTSLSWITGIGVSLTITSFGQFYRFRFEKSKIEVEKEE